MDGVFVGSGIFKSGDPAKRARAIVQVGALRPCYACAAPRCAGLRRAWDMMRSRGWTVLPVWGKSLGPAPRHTPCSGSSPQGGFSPMPAPTSAAPLVPARLAGGDSLQRPRHHRRGVLGPGGAHGAKIAPWGARAGRRAGGRGRAAGGGVGRRAGPPGGPAPAAPVARLASWCYRFASNRARHLSERAAAEGQMPKAGQLCQRRAGLTCGTVREPPALPPWGPVQVGIDCREEDFKSYAARSE